MTASNPQRSALAEAAGPLCVKWATPADELVGIAALVHALIEDEDVHGSRICLAVPNLNWAVQLQRACEGRQVRTSVCLPPARLDAAARRSLAKLAVLASPADGRAREALERLGESPQDIRRMLDDYGSSGGFTLVRMLGLRDNPVFAHALLHASGDEDASRLQEIVLGQLARPTLPASSSIVSIVHYGAVPRRFDWVFLVGCVDGLVPAPGAFDAPTEREREAVLDECRRAFNDAVAAADKHAVVSLFAKADARLAEQARIRFARCKREHGERVAMCAPTLYLNEAGAARPSTIGGQALLRAHNAN